MKSCPATITPGTTRIEPRRFAHRSVASSITGNRVNCLQHGPAHLFQPPNKAEADDLASPRLDAFSGRCFILWTSGWRVRPDLTRSNAQLCSVSLVAVCWAVGEGKSALSSSSQASLGRWIRRTVMAGARGPSSARRQPDNPNPEPAKRGADFTSGLPWPVVAGSEEENLMEKTKWNHVRPP